MEWATEYGISSPLDNLQPQTNMQTGIIAAKKALNQLHYELGYRGFDQVLFFLIMCVY